MTEIKLSNARVAAAGDGKEIAELWTRFLPAVDGLDAWLPSVVDELLNKSLVNGAIASAESGSVLGFTIRAQEDVGSEGVRAIMMIEVAGQSSSQVLRGLRGIPELRRLHSTNGKWDLIGEITAASLPDFDRVLRDVRGVAGIINSETSILLSSV